MDKQQEFALRTVEERDVRFIRLWFTDVLGTLKSVAIAPAELEAAFEEGLGFDGSAVEGLTRVSEDDMIVKPDPSTFQILPWRGGPQGTARMFCDVLTPDGEPSLGDPRHVLKQALAKAKEKGVKLLLPVDAACIKLFERLACAVGVIERDDTRPREQGTDALGLRLRAGDQQGAHGVQRCVHSSHLGSGI